MEAMRRMVRPIVPVDKHRAYVVKAVHLVPHRHTKCEVLLPQENVTPARGANFVPFSRGSDAFHPVVEEVVVERGLDSANL